MTFKWCVCDGFYGEWFCTEDCGGGSCIETGILGDLNDDGYVNLVDIFALASMILEGSI